MPEVVQCPHCDRRLRVNENLLGKKVRCPSCGETFQTQPPVQESVVEIDEDAPPRSARDHADLEQDYDEEATQRRRPSSQRQRRAREAVMFPAVALIVLGIAGLGYGALNVVAFLSGQQPMLIQKPQDPAKAQAYEIGLRIGAFGSVLWAVFVLLGGIAMITLRARPMAYVGSIVAMLPCTLCCVGGLPVGIWALIVLNKPEVQAGFRS